MVNPLIEFMRKPELCVKLPSNGNWYPEGMIDYTLNGEVEVYPLLPRDELIMLNPDMLLSGEANIEILKSCVPSIKEPGKLLYPDANTLILAIQKASYGNTLSMSIVCPECQRKAIELKTREAIEEAEKREEIILHPQEVEFDIDQILSTMTFLDKEYIVELDNGLKVYVQPNTLQDKMKYGLMKFNNEKILTSFKNYNFEDTIENDELKKMRLEIQQCYLKMNELGNQLITSCITQIKLPDETFVTDKEHIYEFITKTKSSEVSKIHEKIQEINDIGLPPILTYECGCCHYEWDEKFYGYNQVDFFGIGS